MTINIPGIYKIGINESFVDISYNSYSVFDMITGYLQLCPNYFKKDRQLADKIMFFTRYRAYKDQASRITLH